MAIAPITGLLMVVAFAAPLGGAPSQTQTCATVAACVFGKNTASGPGVEGTSASGTGIVGASNSGFGVTASSNSGVALQAQSQSGDAIDARADGFGISAISASALYGNAISANSTNGYGVVANVTGVGVALLGNSNTGSAVAGNATNGYGVEGVSTNGIGVDAVTFDGPAAISAVAESSKGTAVTATSASVGVVSSGSPAFLALGGATTGLEVQMGAAPGTRAAALQLFTGTAARGTQPRPANVLVGTSTLGTTTNPRTVNVVRIDGAGNEILAGRLTASGATLSRTQTSANGRVVAAFGSRLATPTIEDTGDGELVRGSAYVALESTFASAIDPNAKYLVFVTPQGESNGLYVTNVTHRGFAVRESHGGRGNLAFDYRIVARPFDTKMSRLPDVNELPESTDTSRVPSQVPKLPAATRSARHR